MRKFMQFVMLLMRCVRKHDWSKEYHAMLLVALVMCGIIIVEVGKKHDIELERQRQAEMLEIEQDKLVNQEVTR